MSDYQKQLDRIEPAKIEVRDDCTIVSARGGCAFVTSPTHPHLGGNLDGGDPSTQYPHTLWPWLMETFEPRTMLDIGCGEGHAMNWFVGKGVDILGVEGLKRNVQICKDKGLKCVPHDFTEGPFVSVGVDLIWCSDVLEHIEERYLSNIFATFRLARVVAVSHGEEGHEKCGWHHVTNRMSSWWLERFEKEGFQHDLSLTMESREVCDEEGWWSLTGKIFSLRAVAESQTSQVKP